MNLYQCAKNQAFSSLCSRDLVNLKILKSDWPRGFWLIVISGIRLLQIWDLCKHTANNMNFHYRPKSEKIINDQFFQSIQKNVFLAHFGAKILFSKNPALSCTKPHGLLTTCCVPENTNDPIIRKLWVKG